MLTRYLKQTFLSSESKSKTPHSLLSDDRSVGSQLPGDWETYHSLQEIKTALSKTIAKIITIQIEVLGEKAEPNDLNIAITNGNSFVACRFRNHATEQPPSLYYSTTAGVTLNRQFPDDPDGCEGPYGSAKVKSANGKQAAEGAEGHNPLAKMNANEHGNHVIIASEPTTYKNSEWALIQKNQVVLVGASGTIETVETLSYPGNGA
jgi:glutamine amidotransferase